MSTRVSRALLGEGAFGRFGEVLLVGLAVSVLCLPLVTVLPAFAAGSAHLRRHLDSRSDTVADLWRDFVAALRGGGWLWSLAVAAALVLLAVNLSVSTSGALPGGRAAQAAVLAATSAIVVALLRAAAGWEPARPWRQVLVSGARRAYDDLAGSGLLVLAIALCGLIVWMFAPLAVVVPGLLCFAAAAVERRQPSP